MYYQETNLTKKRLFQVNTPSCPNESGLSTFFHIGRARLACSVSVKEHVRKHCPECGSLGCSGHSHSTAGAAVVGVRILWNLIIVMSLAKDAMLFRVVVALHNNVCNFVRPSGQVYLPTADSTEKGSSISSHGQILNSMTIQFHCLPGTFLKGIFPLLLFL